MNPLNDIFDFSLENWFGSWNPVNWVSDIVNTVVDVVTDAVDTVTDAVDDAVDFVGDVAGGLVRNLF